MVLSNIYNSRDNTIKYWNSNSDSTNIFRLVSNFIDIILTIVLYHSANEISMRFIHNFILPLYYYGHNYFMKFYKFYLSYNFIHLTFIVCFIKLYKITVML